MSYSTQYFRFAEGDDPSLTPDVAVDLTLNDYLALRDPVLEAILAKGAFGPLERLLDSRSEGDIFPNVRRHPGRIGNEAALSGTDRCAHRAHRRGCGARSRAREHHGP
ncbi:MAG: hypothetical protein MZU91_10925 [Desulfosudis oleivorans]|nr:hypothetical protein [Desulfosudis oleivorans]